MKILCKRLAKKYVLFFPLGKEGVTTGTFFSQNEWSGSSTSPDEQLKRTTAGNWCLSHVMTLSFLGRPVGFVNYRKSYYWCNLSRSQLHVTCSWKDLKLERTEWCALTTPSGGCQEPAHQRWGKLSCFRSCFFLWHVYLPPQANPDVLLPVGFYNFWQHLVHHKIFCKLLIKILYWGFQKGADRGKGTSRLNSSSCQFIAHILRGVYFNPYITDWQNMSQVWNITYTRQDII